MRLLMTAASWDTIGLAHQLEQHQFLVSRAETWDDFLYLASHHAHDALIYSGDLPDPRPKTEQAAVALLSRTGTAAVAVRSDAEAAALFDAGADVVTRKTEAPEVLCARIRAAVLRRSGHVPPQVAAAGFEIDVIRRRLRVSGQDVHLTPLQYELVERLALSSGRTVSRSDLLEALYGWEEEPGTRVLDTFLHGIRQRISLAGGDPSRIQTRRGAGFLLDVPGLRNAG